jgi:protein involved in polysaccharide export with SLBB domain
MKGTPVDKRTAVQVALVRVNFSGENAPINQQSEIQEDVMFPKRLRRLCFSLKSMLVLILGMAIGYSLNLHTLQLLTGLAAYSSSPPPYVIEPPDILSIDVLGNISAASRSISGQHLVGPDGRINLGKCGQVYVAGMTISEAQEAVKKMVAQQIVSPQILVDVFATNSKVYYIITRGQGTGDSILQVPFTGNETILDAIAQVGDLKAPHAIRLSLVRARRNGAGYGKELPINWGNIAQGTSLKTNYRVLPGDRVILSAKPTRASAN